jgi:PTS system nitrogen regulatory IIA component
VALEDVLDPDCTRSDLACASRKRALESAGEILAERFPELEADALFDALMARERLGSTAVGEGVAIPHCRLEGCHRPVAALLRLREGLDFDAPDGRPVDLLFVLVVPAEENEAHLKLLAEAARTLGDADVRAALRAADDDVAVYEGAVLPHPAA